MGARGIRKLFPLGPCSVGDCSEWGVRTYRITTSNGSLHIVTRASLLAGRPLRQLCIKTRELYWYNYTCPFRLLLALDCDLAIRGGGGLRVLPLLARSALFSFFL